jgi:mannonate dehydratase
MFLPPQPNEMWRLAVQLGVTDAVSVLPRLLPTGQPVWDFSSLLLMKQRFADAGLTLSVIENWPPMDHIRLGLQGRDEEIEHICEMLSNMGAVGIGVWCYNFMAVLGWLRTSTSTLGRGGALVTSYDHSLMRDAPLTEFGTVSEEKLWDNFAYFLERVVPVAERARVKLALHPDDPPISPIRGIARIITSLDALKRAIELVPSEWNGLTFCQGSIATMGADIPAAIRYFGERQKIHFVHFRDIRGTASRFVETFQDDGPTDMLEAMRCYQEIGFDGPIRPDHSRLFVCALPMCRTQGSDNCGYDAQYERDEEREMQAREEGRDS